MQFVGLDTLSAIAKGWREERVSTGEMEASAVEEVPILEKLVGDGKKGRKSGEGFFKCTSSFACMLACFARNHVADEPLIRLRRLRLIPLNAAKIKSWFAVTSPVCSATPSTICSSRLHSAPPRFKSSHAVPLPQSLSL